jgi:cell division GTPase FtsZ
MGIVPKHPDQGVVDYKQLKGDNVSKKKVAEAPEINDIKLDATNVYTNNVAIYGCGGFGVNTVKRLCNMNLTDIGMDMNNIHVMDTSRSNNRNLPDNVQLHQIAEQGSGKDRATNIDPTMMVLKDHKVTSDINIVLFSLNGGSGSVIGPLLANHIQASGKSVIILAVFDTVGQADVLNTDRTLKTLSHLAKQDKRYFPLILFNNHHGQRVETDKGILAKITTLLDLFIGRDIEEIDLADLRNFLKPKNQIGLFMADIAYIDDSGNGISYPGEVVEQLNNNTICHTTISINEQAVPFQSLSQVAFAGIGPRDIEGFVGLPLPSDLIETIQSDLQQRNTFSVKATDLGDEGNTSSGGIIL